SRIQHIFDDDASDDLIFVDHIDSDVDDWLDPPQTWWRLMIRRRLLNTLDRNLVLVRWVSEARSFHWGQYFFAVFGYSLAGSVLFLAAVVLFQRRAGRM